MSTYGWSADLVEAYRKIEKYISMREAIKILNDGYWISVIPLNVAYSNIPNGLFMSDVEFRIESIVGKKYVLTFREDSVKSSIEQKLGFTEVSPYESYYTSPKCTCGLDASGLGGRHSHYCTFAGLYTIGKDAEQKAKDRLKKKLEEE